MKNKYQFYAFLTLTEGPPVAGENFAQNKSPPSPAPIIINVEQTMPITPAKQAIPRQPTRQEASSVETTVKKGKTETLRSF